MTEHIWHRLKSPIKKTCIFIVVTSVKNKTTGMFAFSSRELAEEAAQDFRIASGYTVSAKVTECGIDVI